jgi:hypothetical protein
LAKKKTRRMNFKEFAKNKSQRAMRGLEMFPYSDKIIKYFRVKRAKICIQNEAAIGGFLATAITDSQRINSSRVAISSRSANRFGVACLFASALPLLVVLQGCGGVSSASAGTASKATPAISVQPASASIQMWQGLQLSVSGAPADAACTWQAAQSSILANLGNGQFQGGQQGTTQVTVSCGTETAVANVAVTAQQSSGPIKITSGGTYSGNWKSTDPNTPAVAIDTDDPVTIQYSVISSKGTLITLQGSKNGANVTIENVTGTALDPGVAGMQRGAFLSATNVTSMVVKNCSIIGASFGIKIAGAAPSTVEITNNLATDLEDRASDGNGGFLASRPELGHFILLNNVSALSGAEIAWNKAVQTIGQSSTEDVINIFNSQGSVGHPISVHDNYMEGSSSPVTNGHYTGTALITDGEATSTSQIPAFVQFEANEVVATAGTGVGIAAGHDISATANRIVSCGENASGNWYAWGANAIVIWNYYGSTQFYNNSIGGTVGGMVGPGTNNAPITYDSWINPPDKLDAGTSISGNDFTDPCLVGGAVNLQAEDAERAYWAAKIAAAGELIGDQHLN